MLILPERNLPKGRILLPQRPQDWRQPSQRTTTFGIENKTRFYLTGRTDDGYIAWRGWFDDREDADAFLYAILTKSLIYERDLWSLPVPAWHPDFGLHLTYDFTTFVTLTSGPGSNQSYSIPLDWNSQNNNVQAIGGGAGGLGGTNGQSGGPGAAWARSFNLALTPGGTATYRIGSGGAGVTNTSGNAGGDSWFNASAFPTSGQAVGARGGPAATRNATTQGGVAGTGTGLGSNSYWIGTSASGSDGGDGGAGVDTTNNCGASGGGAGGPFGGGGNGAAGGSPGAGGGGNGGGSSGQTGAAGGNGGNNVGGTGGGVPVNGATGVAGTDGGGGAGGVNVAGTTSTGGAGGAGSDLGGGVGGGGGGGGAFVSSTASAADVGGNGGSYGAGGGGGGQRLSGTGTGGNGSQGIIALTFETLFLSIPMGGSHPRPRRIRVVDY